MKISETGGTVRITRSLTAIIATILIAGVPLAAPGQFSIGVGFTVGSPPPPIPDYISRLLLATDTSGRRATGHGVRMATTGCLARGLSHLTMPALWTPGYWGFYGGRYLFYPGHWGLHIGFYGGINYGFGYPETGFYGGAWNNGRFAYNTAYTNVNKTVITIPTTRPSSITATSATTARTSATTAARAASMPSRRSSRSPHARAAVRRRRHSGIRRTSRAKIATSWPRSTRASHR